MSIVVAEGVVQITADAKGIPRAISDQISGDTAGPKSAGMSIGRSIFGGVVAAGAALGGAKLVTDFFGGAITGASDLNETVSKSGVIFGSAGADVLSWSENAAKAMGMSKSAALDAAGGFGNIFTQIGFSKDAAAGMSESWVQMASDFASFNNLDPASVIDAMQAATRGEYDSLQAIIPNISAARVETEAMTMTGKAHADQLTATDKALAIQKIMLQDGAAAQGDYERTAGGVANTQRTLTASLEDQQTKLGTALLPMWSNFLGFLTTTAIPVLSTIVGWISQNAEWLGPLSIAIGIATAAMWLFNAAAAANPIGLVIGLIAGLVAGLIWVATQTTFFQDTWKTATAVVGAVVGWLGNIFGTVMKGIGAALNWVWQNAVMPVANFITGAFNAIGSTVQSVFGGIGKFIGDVFHNIVGVIKGPINTVISFLNQAIDGANIVGKSFGINIPHIPMLARGSTNAPDMFIAGEAGPELIVGKGGARVYPADQTRSMLGASGNGVTIGEININEARDPLGSAGRISREVKTWRSR